MWKFSQEFYFPNSATQGIIVTYISHISEEVTPEKLIQKVCFLFVIYQEILGQIIRGVYKLVILFGRPESCAFQFCYL